MGAENSTHQKGHAADFHPHEFVAELEKMCNSGDLDGYKRLWDEISTRRNSKKSTGEPNPDYVAEYDPMLVSNGVMRWVKFALRRPETSWREQGISVARGFFPLKEARLKLINMDFIGTIMVLHLVDITLGEDDDEPAGEALPEKQRELEHLAVEVIREMAAYSEFIRCLCTPAVLNFLCILLVQAPRTVRLVMETLADLSQYEENLPILLECSVADVLETFFKSCDYLRPADDDKGPFQQWALNIKALSDCANTLGTFMKYGHTCRIDLNILFTIFGLAVGNTKAAERAAARSGAWDRVESRNTGPDNMHLLAEMARLLYWMCRRSQNLEAMLRSASLTDNLHNVLEILVRMWRKSVDAYMCVEDLQECWRTGAAPSRNTLKFMRDDVTRQELKLDSPRALLHKMIYAETCMCYMNCLIWCCLPESGIRWKLRDFALRELQLAFRLNQETNVRIVLGTVRHLADLPHTQQCPGYMELFGKRMLSLLERTLHEDGLLTDKLTLFLLLLDTLSILAMQRVIQELLGRHDIWGKLKVLVGSPRREGQLPEEREQQQGLASLPPEQRARIEVAILRMFAEVAVHPTHRLLWLADSHYPPREAFSGDLELLMRQNDDRSDEGVKTIASLLLTMFHEHKFKKSRHEIETTFRSMLNWWQVNTTTIYLEERQAAEYPAADGPPQGSKIAPVKELLQRAIADRIAGRAMTSIETLPYCSPHECVLALSLFSRLALEPKFKRMITESAIEPLLGCVCVGIWAEAREAAATLANLMWMPDMDEERLVCWLKFDGPNCIAVDAANVLLPIKVGNPKPVHLGKGMYKLPWGMEFVEGSCVVLHPDGLTTDRVPGMLTSASPGDTFKKGASRPYNWFDDAPPVPKHFTVTCWFYWPLRSSPSESTKAVLIQSKKKESGAPGNSQVYYDFEIEQWVLQDEDGANIPLETPALNPGWHMLSLVSSTSSAPSAKKFDGTKFWLDTFAIDKAKRWVDNEIYMVGNDGGYGGRKPFGLIADFRIYARALSDDEIMRQVRAKGTDGHPDQVARRLAQADAAAVLAQRLDVPDCAAECLRALASLATLASTRAPIYNVCGREILRLLDSPLPMIQRQAARLLNNLT